MIDSMTLFFTTDFVLYALAAGISLSLVAGPLGSFIVWRRMSYFGDTLAHSALLGIALGLITDSNPQLSIIICCLLFAFILTLLDRRPLLSTDALLGILAHSSLALGIVVLALADSVRVDLEAYLFGALLTIGNADLIWILLVSTVVAIVLYLFWNDFLSITIHAEIAEIEGANVKRLNLILVFLIAFTIAVSMKIVGVLLITSLLIIPPAAARSLASTPEQMAVKASLVGSISVVLGLISAFYFDVPVGPSIVVVATLIFLLFYFYPSVLKSKS
ncbi:MAG: iron chelate uptake ABC transporter family permease subunit [Gammaproteobacteria bacterium]|jgi:zinc transport system permease protein|nr:iron chelate uptake ABC transporter family permease subunit [Gammaproteobacteria bacterium]MDG2338250.1 iron chelate uptake ABC transporter family permease subunit [Gammaproteobacteria bacterium]